MRPIPLASRDLGAKVSGRPGSRAPKFLDVAMPEHQGFLAFQSHSAKVSCCLHPGRPGFLTPQRPDAKVSCATVGARIRALPPIPTPSPPSPPGENPARTWRGPWEGLARARSAPGASRGGPGAASRDLEAPGPCPGTPPAFRGQNPASIRPFCPLKPGRIREAPGGVLPEASAGQRRGAARRRPRIRMRIRRSVGGMSPPFSKRRTFSVRRMDAEWTRGRADPPGPGRFPPLRPGLPPEKPGPGPGGPRRSQGFQPGSGPG
jgi:hypothetical protein